MYLIPAIDLRDGNCVRLAQGDFERRTDYSADPLEVARRFEAQGAAWLHLVDLDGARSGKPEHLPILASIAQKTSLHVEFGGGMRSRVLVESALRAGAQRVVVGTAALDDPELLADLCARYGDQIMVGIDARDGKVATKAWVDVSTVDALAFARAAAKAGAGRLIYTDIATDGMLTGPNLAGVRAMIDAAGLPLIASGGVATIAHLEALADAGAEAAIVGRALYTGDIPLTALRDWAA